MQVRRAEAWLDSLRGSSSEEVGESCRKFFQGCLIAELDPVEAADELPYRPDFFSHSILLSGSPSAKGSMQKRPDAGNTLFLRFVNLEMGQEDAYVRSNATGSGRDPACRSGRKRGAGTRSA